MKKFKIKKLYILLIIIALTALAICIYFNNNSIKKINNPPPNESSTSSYYSSLYGTWSVTKHIPSKIKTNLSDSVISLCINQKFTIEKDKITSLLGTINNPVISEGTITASDFSNKYNDTLKNLGIPGDTLKYINITETDKGNHSVTIFIANDGKVYALLSGALFELERQ
ncbi:hypothetical protein [Clostridium sp.]|uniref:hypothetical protein n=1 Tax=Clostridium sp. TaxID=1506 RepID=UPI00284BA1EC|nr:hypothetical protein [Clostridium sp.]MDR3594567.1 hypothetical protein [Clostridium sp.]